MSARIGLIGYGLAGRAFHAPFVAAGERTRLVAVVTGHPAHRAEVERRYSDTRVLGGVDQLLALADELDAVVVATPNATHVALAEAVLGVGLTAVVDKPVAPSAAALRGLADLASVAGRSVVPFHNRRFDGDFLTVTGLLERGALGAVHRYEAHWDRWRPEVATAGRSWKGQGGPDAATGVLFDLGPHLVDQAVACFGRPEQVYAEVRTVRAGSAVADDAFVAFVGPGPAVHLGAGALVGEAAPRFRVLGERGAFVKHGLDPQEAALVSGVAPGGPGWGEEPRAQWGWLAAGSDRTPVPTVAGDYGRFYAGLAAHLLDGAPPPVPLDAALAVAEVLDAAVRSAATGQVVPVGA